MNYLTDEAITVILDIEWSLQRLEQQIRYESVGFGGRLSEKLWGDFEAFQVPVLNIPTSDAMIINEWFETQKQLYFYFDQSTSQVLITNLEPPFMLDSAPYHNEHNGFIRLEQI
jgi:hypothetical protein